MKTALAFVGCLLIASAAQAQEPISQLKDISKCSIQPVTVDAHGTVRRFYLCDAYRGMGSTEQIPVSESFFTRFCHVTTDGATCDAILGAGQAAKLSDAAHPPWPAATCGVAAVKVGTHTRKVYACDAYAYLSGEIERIAVQTPWFKAHCQVAYGVSVHTAEWRTQDVAYCDEVYVGHQEPYATAAGPPSSFKTHLKAVGYGAAMVGVLALCVAGGCGFMGGGAR